MKCWNTIFIIVVLVSYNSCSLVYNTEGIPIKCQLIGTNIDPCKELGEEYYCAIEGVGATGICKRRILCIDNTDCPVNSCCHFQKSCNSSNENCRGFCLPKQQELCDNIDNDCDGFIDEDFDKDGDGFVAYGVECINVDIFDCDDNDSTVSPVTHEICGDGKDNNCDGRIDEGFDIDQDGYKVCIHLCAQDPKGCDCNDYNDTIFTGAIEFCNGRDDNCDNRVDEGFGIDFDGDNYNDCSSMQGCPNAELIRCDCNDRDPNITPDAVELCDNIDNNCDGQIDENFDKDGDGMKLCVDQCKTQVCDCNDNDSNIHPGVSEVCDGIDNNCDGRVDEGGDGLCGSTLICAGINGCIISGGNTRCQNDSDCKSSEVCAPQLGVCFERKGFFQDCLIDIQCDYNYKLSCIDLATQGMSGRFCTKVCSKTEDCSDVNGYCLKQHLSTGICIPRSWVQLGNNTRCNNGSDCSDGICGWDDNNNSTYVCHEVCSNDNDCGSNEHCGLIRNNWNILAGPSSSFPNSYQQWNTDTDYQLGCVSGASDLYSYESWFNECNFASYYSICTVPCCSNSNCESASFPRYYKICLPAWWDELNQYVAVCLISSRIGNKSIGESCTSDEDCQSLTCIGYCTELCCTQDDCPQGYRCKPYLGTNNLYVSLCIKE